ncbi:hypothetical protein OH492_02940 [Vibrio chagasii]|nr:hypothetical protein [Vibrio chagasii]
MNNESVTAGYPVLDIKATLYTVKKFLP